MEMEEELDDDTLFTFLVSQVFTLQGYLAHKKTPTPPRTPLGPWA